MNIWKLVTIVMCLSSLWLLYKIYELGGWWSVFMALLTTAAGIIVGLNAEHKEEK